MSTEEQFELPCLALIERARSIDNAPMLGRAKKRLKMDAEVFSDSLVCLHRTADLDHAQTVLEPGVSREVTVAKGARWEDIGLSNARHAISGTFHGICQAKSARR